MDLMVNDVKLYAYTKLHDVDVDDGPLLQEMKTLWVKEEHDRLTSECMWMANISTAIMMFFGIQELK